MFRGFLGFIPLDKNLPYGQVLTSPGVFFCMYSRPHECCRSRSWSFSQMQQSFVFAHLSCWKESLLHPYYAQMIAVCSCLLSYSRAAEQWVVAGKTWTAVMSLSTCGTTVPVMEKFSPRPESESWWGSAINVPGAVSLSQRINVTTSFDCQKNFLLLRVLGDILYFVLSKTAINSQLECHNWEDLHMSKLSNCLLISCLPC